MKNPPDFTATFPIANPVIKIKNRRMEWRDCDICGETFICRADNPTFTCRHKCRMEAAWRTRRLHDD